MDDRLISCTSSGVKKGCNSGLPGWNARYDLISSVSGIVDSTYLVVFQGVDELARLGKWVSRYLQQRQLGKTAHDAGRTLISNAASLHRTLSTSLNSNAVRFGPWDVNSSCAASARFTMQTIDSPP